MAALKVLKTYANIFDNSVKLFTEFCSKKLYKKFIMVTVPQISTVIIRMTLSHSTLGTLLEMSGQVTVDSRRTALEAISTSSCNVSLWDQMRYPLGIFHHTKIFLENVFKEHFIIKYTI